MSNLYKLTYVFPETGDTSECIFLFRSVKEAELHAQEHTPEDAVASVSIHSSY